MPKSNTDRARSKARGKAAGNNKSRAPAAGSPELYDGYDNLSVQISHI